MTKRSILLFVCFGLTRVGQGQNDFRNLSWGMSIEEIKRIEVAPLTKEEKNLVGYRNGQAYFDGINLVYENVTVAGKTADIYYECKNGKLVKVRVVYRPALYGYEGKMSEVILRFEELFSGFERRGFKYSSPLQCGEHVYSGADYQNPDNEKIRRMPSRNIDRAKLELVDKMISEKHYKAAFFRIENERSGGSVMFLSDYSEWRKNTPVIFELYPSYEIEKKIKESDF